MSLDQNMTKNSKSNDKKYNHVGTGGASVGRASIAMGTILYARKEPRVYATA